MILNLSTASECVTPEFIKLSSQVAPQSRVEASVCQTNDGSQENQIAVLSFHKLANGTWSISSSETSECVRCNGEPISEMKILKNDDMITFDGVLPVISYRAHQSEDESLKQILSKSSAIKHKMSPREPCSSRISGNMSPSHDGYSGSFKVPRMCRTVPSSPIWQLSPSHDSFHGENYRLQNNNLFNRRLCQERDVLIDEWMRVLKSREEALTLSHTSSDKDCNSLEALKRALRAELTAEYNAKLTDAENRLKAEVASRDKLQEVLSSELNLKDSQLKGEKKKLQETVEILESELQCSICSELFINAVTLGCSHSFCEFCIGQWKSKPHSQRQCPICRSTIATEVRSLVLDQYIHRVVQHLDEDLLGVRNEIIRQRRELEEMQALSEKMQSSDQQPSTSNSGSGGQTPISGPASDVHSRVSHHRRYTPNRDRPQGGYRGRQGSSSSSNYRQFRMGQPNRGHRGDDPGRQTGGGGGDDHQGYTGIPGRYFGGYGHCYKCGRRGHWANGCPF